MWLNSWAIFLQTAVRPRLHRRGLRPAAAGRRLARGPRPWTTPTAASTATARARLFRDARCRRAGRRPGEAGQPRRPGRQAARSIVASTAGRTTVILWHDLKTSSRAIEQALPPRRSTVLRLARTSTSARTRIDRLRATATSGCSSTKPSAAGSGLQLPAPLPPGGLRRRQLQVQRLHPGRAPHPPVPAATTRSASTSSTPSPSGRSSRPCARKWAQHEELTDTMTEIIREYGLARALHRRSARPAPSASSGSRSPATGGLLANNDCVDETRATWRRTSST